MTTPSRCATIRYPRPGNRPAAASIAPNGNSVVSGGSSSATYPGRRSAVGYVGNRNTVQREVSCGASALLAATVAPSGIAANAARVAEPERAQYEGLARSRNGNRGQSA